MATSTCPKCEGTSFEVKQTAPSGSNFYLWLVQCSSCGAVVSSHEADNIGALLEAHKKSLGKIEERLSRIEHALNVLANR